MGNNICSCIKPKEELNEMQFNDESPSLPTIDNDIQCNTNLSEYYYEHEQTIKTKSKNIQPLQTQYNISQIILLQSHIRSFIYRINYSLNIKHSLQLHEDSLIKTQRDTHLHGQIKPVTTWKFTLTTFLQYHIQPETFIQVPDAMNRDVI